MDYSKFIVSKQKEESISKQRVNEQVSSIRYKLACAYSEDSNLSAHPQSD